MSELNYVNSKKNIILYLGLILTLGLILRFYYLPYDVPIVTDGFYSFVYAAKTVFEGNLPIGYGTTNTGWANFLALFFSLSDTSDPFYLMQIQRSLSVILSSLTIIPAFFIFRKFVNIRWALFGCLLLTIEPKLLMQSLEGINYTLFFFLFVSAIALFLTKTKLSLFLSFGCIACITLVRYEGLLLLIPLSIMYFLKFKDKKSIVKFLGMIFIIIIILAPISVLRIQATESFCYDTDWYGMRCGDDGFTHSILAGPRFLSHTLNAASGQEVTETAIYLLDENNEKNDSYAILFMNKIILSFSALLKFTGLALIPYFVFFVSYNIILRIKNKKLGKLDWDKKIIIFTVSIMFLPALYAYMMGIQEIRYVLVIIPLLCILSISWTSSISEKISKNRSVIIILIVLVLTSSIIFIEFEKRDSTHDKESFLVSQKIVKLTNMINSFHQDGYIKTSVLISDWPILPEADQKGKLLHVFQKIPTNDYHDLAEFVIDSKKSDLKYLVIDKDNKLFDDLRKNPAGYPYLNKIFDSNDFDFENHFMIYEINYKLFDNNDK
jgi:hypothetical protein